MKDADAVRAQVASERLAQGLPPTIEDPDVIARLAAILLAGTKR